MIRRLAVLLLLFVPVAAAAQHAIPTPDEFLGYRLGERFTPWNRILDYFGELARTTPLLTLHRVGETYEGRPLVVAVITAPKNRANLEAIRRDVGTLAQGEVEAASLDAVVHRTPAVVWLGFGVHGNESSSAEASMRVASELVREGAATLLDELVVVLDPLQNPDGRERYVQWFTRTRGARENPNPDAAEHYEPWPGGRFNHYLQDMNRDWAWASQRETLARVLEYRKWNPQVFVDFHEMSPTSTYFFPPSARPINAHLPAAVEEWLAVFGRANADAFSSRGWPFFVAERFDLFYPAYGDSWPSLRGAIGMTYEVAGGGRGGTAFRREDDSVLRLGFRIEQHFTSAMTTLRTAAARREELLRYFHEASRTQVRGGRNVYLLLRDSPAFEPVVAMLQAQGIHVDELSSAVTLRAAAIAGAAETRTFPAGTAVVSSRQPLGRLVETLLEKSPNFPPGFLEEQQAKTQADEPDDFYDLTSWSLPLAANVSAYSVPAPFTGALRPYAAAPRGGFTRAGYGYLADGLEPGIYRLAGELLRRGINFSVSEDEVSVGTRKYARGTLVVLKGNNREGFETSLEEASRTASVGMASLESGWSGGTAFGSERIRFVRDPKIGLVGGSGVGATSFGSLWHTLDIDTPIPHTTLTLDVLRNLDLSRYRVLVLPDGEGYADRLGKRGIEKLQAWVRDGGTLVAIGNASRFLREKEVELSKLKAWEPPKKKDDDPPREERYNEFRVPGSAFRTVMNTRTYLTFGVPRPPAVLIEGTVAYQPLPHRVDNVVTVERKDPLISGVAWPESIERIRGSVYLASEPVGRGSVITFAGEPFHRSFWRGTLPLLLNAVLYSPSFPRQ